MQVGAVGVAGFPTNNSYDSAAMAAESADFSKMLEEAQRKLATEHGTNHIVNTANINEQDKQLKEACKGFETMFLQMMYRQMRKTVPENAMFKKSNAMNIFEDMRDSELMKQTADGGGVGLADLIYKQLAPSVLQQDAMERAQHLKK